MIFGHFGQFLAKIWTLWMNISRTEIFLDMQFSQVPHNWLVLHSERVRSKSLEPFSRKVEKPPFRAHFRILWMIFFLDNVSKQPKETITIWRQWLIWRHHKIFARSLATPTCLAVTSSQKNYHNLETRINLETLKKLQGASPPLLV